MTSARPEPVEGSESGTPVFQVIKGNPTPEELAAVVAVLSVAGGASAEGAPPSAPSGWSAHWRNVRAPLTPGPGAWRSSGGPA